MLKSFSVRRLTALWTASFLLGTLATVPVHAAEQTTLYLRPHCESAKEESCTSFEVLDPRTFRTDNLSPGDTLDMDVILHNTSLLPIQRVRAWLSYDPTSLEGFSVELGKKLPVPVPGEADFSASEGLAKISATADDEMEPKDEFIVVAHVQFKVKDGASGQTPISFYDPTANLDGHTFAVAKVGRLNSSLLSPSSMGALVVYTVEKAPEEAPAASSSSEASSTKETPTAPTDTPRTVETAPQVLLPFSQLQVQNVKITTRDSNMYLSWDPLQSPSTVGYYVYYGTQMGRYLQRKSLPLTANSVTIRDLPTGTSYYAAVRAVSNQNEESAFSQEVAVQIGNPSTSTAQLLGMAGGNADTTAPSNPLHQGAGVEDVPGESGPSTTLFLIIGASAVIGTFFAIRRQFSAATLRRS